MSVILTANEISTSISRTQGLAVFQKRCAKFPALFIRVESVWVALSELELDSLSRVKGEDDYSKLVEED